MILLSAPTHVNPALPGGLCCASVRVCVVLWQECTARGWRTRCSCARRRRWSSCFRATGRLASTSRRLPAGAGSSTCTGRTTTWRPSGPTDARRSCRPGSSPRSSAVPSADSAPAPRRRPAPMTCDHLLQPCRHRAPRRCRGGDVGSRDHRPL